MLGIRFIKVPPTAYLLQYQNGRLVREGLGLAFFYYAPTTTLVAVPTASNEVPFIFEETTADFQMVTIQGQITYRVTEPKKLAALMNFMLTPTGEGYATDDPEKLPQRLINIVNVAEIIKLRSPLICQQKAARKGRRKSFGHLLEEFLNIWVSKGVADKKKPLREQVGPKADIHEMVRGRDSFLILRSSKDQRFRVIERAMEFVQNAVAGPDCRQFFQR